MYIHMCIHVCVCVCIYIYIYICYFIIINRTTFGASGRPRRVPGPRRGKASQISLYRLLQLLC